MKRRSRDFSDSRFDDELISGEETEWPAVVRRLAVKVQPRPHGAPRKNRLSQQIDSEERAPRSARARPEGAPH